jgi:hypothetical protein
MINRIRTRGLPTVQFAAILVRIAGEVARRRLEAWNQTTQKTTQLHVTLTWKPEFIHGRFLSDTEVKKGVSMPTNTVKADGKIYKVDNSPPTSEAATALGH